MDLPDFIILLRNFFDEENPPEFANNYYKDLLEYERWKKSIVSCAEYANRFIARQYIPGWYSEYEALHENININLCTHPHAYVSIILREYADPHSSWNTKKANENNLPALKEKLELSRNVNAARDEDIFALFDTHIRSVINHHVYKLKTDIKKISTDKYFSEEFVRRSEKKEIKDSLKKNSDLTTVERESLTRQMLRPHPKGQQSLEELAAPTEEIEAPSNNVPRAIDQIDVDLFRSKFAEFKEFLVTEKNYRPDGSKYLIHRDLLFFCRFQEDFKKLFLLLLSPEMWNELIDATRPVFNRIEPRPRQRTVKLNNLKTNIQQAMAIQRKNTISAPPHEIEKGGCDAEVGPVAKAEPSGEANLDINEEGFCTIFGVDFAKRFPKMGKVPVIWKQWWHTTKISFFKIPSPPLTSLKDQT